MIETTKYSPLKIYTDATIRPTEDMSPSTVAAVYKNHNGELVGKFGSQIAGGLCSTQAEFEAVLRGVAHVEHVESIQHVKVYTDAQAITGHYGGNTNDRLMEKYRNALVRSSQKFDSFTLSWIERDDNEAADVLADAIHDMTLGHYSDFNGRWFR